MRGWRRGAIWLPERPAASNGAAVVSGERRRRVIGHGEENRRDGEAHQSEGITMDRTASSEEVVIDGGVRWRPAAEAEDGGEIPAVPAFPPSVRARGGRGGSGERDGDHGGARERAEHRRRVRFRG